MGIPVDKRALRGLVRPACERRRSDHRSDPPVGHRCSRPGDRVCTPCVGLWRRASVHPMRAIAGVSRSGARLSVRCQRAPAASVIRNTIRNGALPISSGWTLEPCSRWPELIRGYQNPPPRFPGGSWLGNTPREARCRAVPQRQSRLGRLADNWQAPLNSTGSPQLLRLPASAPPSTTSSATGVARSWTETETRRGCQP